MDRVTASWIVSLLAVTAAGCTEPSAGSPHPLSVTPDRGAASLPAAIVIRGSGFGASVSTDFTEQQPSTLDARFAAWLGTVPLLDVRLRSDGTLAATVPAGLALGLHALRVVDPEGREGLLPDAYLALADADAAALVASYRVDPIGPQRAWSPFGVTVTALDAAGAPVTAFNGAVSLSDLTGTAVPATLALFTDGVWSGAVEVRSAHAADVLRVVDAYGNAGASAPFPVAPSPSATLRISTPPRIVTAGQCSGATQPLTLELFDAFGAPTRATGALALSAALAPSGPIEFFSDESCGRSIPQPTFAAGQQTVTVWFRATRAGVATLQLSAATLPPASQLLTVYAVGELPVRSPPAAVLIATPAVTWVGQPVAFDASGSSDYQTASDALEVSWDFEGTATGAPPWTAWTGSSRTASHAFTAAGTYTARVAVRDADGDVGFASVTVVVRASSADRLCLVDVAEAALDLDDGAAGCAPGASRGADGQLSLVEALRLAVDGDVIAFAPHIRQIATGTPYVISRGLQLVAPGVVMTGSSITVGSNTGVTTLTGLELTGAGAQVAVPNGQKAAFKDVWFHDFSGIVAKGFVTLDGVRMSGCAAACFEKADFAGPDLVTIRYSDFRGAGSGAAVSFTRCAKKLVLEAQSNVFAGFGEAIRFACDGSATVVHNTFEGNGTGVAYAGASSGHVLRNNVFTNQLTAAAACDAGTSFSGRDYHLLWPATQPPGCLAGDADTLTSDPRYVLPTRGDFRLLPASPAVDSAWDLSLNLIPAFPSPAALQHLGNGPDRGGLESY